MSKDYGDIAMGGSQDDPSAEGTQHGANPKPTRAPLADRSASPDAYATSGMERAMHRQANKEHPVAKRTEGKNGIY